MFVPKRDKREENYRISIHRALETVIQEIVPVSEVAVNFVYDCLNSY
jgi:hypothetical protein